MFSNIVVGLVMAIGLGGWVYGKTYRSSGGNNQTALVGAGVVALIAFIVVITLLSVVFKK